MHCPAVAAVIASSCNGYGAVAVATMLPLMLPPVSAAAAGTICTVRPRRIFVICISHIIACILDIYCCCSQKQARPITTLAEDLLAAHDRIAKMKPSFKRATEEHGNGVRFVRRCTNNHAVVNGHPPAVTLHNAPPLPQDVSALPPANHHAAADIAVTTTTDAVGITAFCGRSTTTMTAGTAAFGAATTDAAGTAAFGVATTDAAGTAAFGAATTDAAGTAAFGAATTDAAGVGGYAATFGGYSTSTTTAGTADFGAETTDAAGIGTGTTTTTSTTTAGTAAFGAAMTDADGISTGTTTNTNTTTSTTTMTVPASRGSASSPQSESHFAITLVESTAPPTAHNRTSTIQWDRKSFQVAVSTEHCTLDKFMLHFHTKSQIEATIAGAEGPWKSKLVQLQSLLEEFFLAQYHTNSDAWDLQLRNLVGTDPCVYWALFHNGQDKDGMTFRGRDRVLEQNVRVAALLMTLEEMRVQVPNTVIDAIAALQLPGLHFHVNKVQYLKDLIAMQVCEGFLACLWGLGTSVILERLLQLPSSKVEATLAPIANFGQDALDFMQDIPNRGVSALLTWEPLPVAMREMAQSSEFLQAHVHEAPGEGGLVKLNRLIHLFGDKLGSWQNAVPVCPRLVELDQVIAKLSPLLQGDIEDGETVQAILLVHKKRSKAWHCKSTSAAQEAQLQSVTNQRMGTGQ